MTVDASLPVLTHFVLTWFATVLALLASMVALFALFTFSSVRYLLMTLVLGLSGVLSGLHGASFSVQIPDVSHQVDGLIFRSFHGMLWLSCGAFLLWYARPSHRTRILHLSLVAWFSIITVASVSALILFQSPSHLFDYSRAFLHYIPAAFLLFSTALFGILFIKNKTYLNLYLFIACFPHMTAEFFLIFGNHVFEDHNGVSYVLTVLFYVIILLGMIYDIKASAESNHCAASNKQSGYHYLPIGEPTWSVHLIFPFVSFILSACMFFVMYVFFTGDYKYNASSIMLLCLSLCFLSLLISYGLSKKILSPLIQMTQSIKIYDKNGELKNLPINAKDEFGMVARGVNNLFNRMTIILKSEKEISRSLKESYERLNSVFESTQEGILVFDESGYISIANQAVNNIFGYDEKGLVGRSLLEILDFELNGNQVDKNENLGEDILSIVADGCELNAIKKDDSDFLIHISISKFPAINQFMYTALIRDVSLEKHVKLEQEKSILMLLSILESTGNGILVTDAYGNVIQHNQRFLELWRMPESLLKAKDEVILLDFVTNQLRDPESFIQDVNYYNQNIEIEVSDTILFLDGREYERVSLPMHVNNIAVGRVWSFRDITEVSNLKQNVGRI